MTPLYNLLCISLILLTGSVFGQTKTISVKLENDIDRGTVLNSNLITFVSAGESKIYDNSYFFYRISIEVLDEYQNLIIEKISSSGSLESGETKLENRYLLNGNQMAKTINPALDEFYYGEGSSQFNFVRWKNYNQFILQANNFLTDIKNEKFIKKFFLFKIIEKDKTLYLEISNF